MGSSSSSVAPSQPNIVSVTNNEVMVRPRPCAETPKSNTSDEAVNYKPNDENVNRLVQLQTISRRNKHNDHVKSSRKCGDKHVDDFEERQKKNQESVYILKQLYKRMDPAVMKTLGEAKGEVKLSFKYDERREMLLVKVVSARDLSAKDIRGKSSDPYVKMEVLPDIHSEGAKTTRHARQTLMPTYNEIFTFKMAPGDVSGSIFRVQVLSHDPLGKDDFMGERIIQLSDWDLSDIWTSWFELQPETDLDIQGDLEVSLSHTLPDTLTVTIHGATDLLSRDQDQLPDPYVKVIITGVPKGAETRVQRGTLSPVWEESFVYTLAKEELMDRYIVFHVVDKAMIGGTDILGQAYIDLTDLDIYNGYNVKLGLADLQNSDRVRTHFGQSATVQEFKEAMYAHSVYRYPSLVFGSSHSGNKVMSVTCRKAGSSAKMRLIDGLPT